MKFTYYVTWTYMANYSEKPIEVQAESAEAAAKCALGLYSDDFKAKAKVYVWSFPPLALGAWH